MRQYTPRAACSVLATMVLLGIVQVLQAGQAPASIDPATPDATPLTHTLFMGVELAVQREKLMLPVQDVQDRSIIARRKGKEVRIPTSGKSLNLKVTRSLKVSDQLATIDKLSVERAFTSATNPLQQFAAEAGAAAGADAVASLAMGRMADAMANNDFAQIAASRTDRVDTNTPRQKMDRAVQDFSVASQAAQSSTLSPGEAASRMEGDLADANYDALRVSFTVSAHKPLPKAYVVLLAQLRSGDAANREQYNWVYAKALGAVDETPRTVSIQQAGFPPGYVIEKFQVHLFNEGEELATNQSLMRVALSRDEAFQDSAIEYIAQNKDATSPAALAGGQRTDALRTHLQNGYEGGPVYVKVSQDGLARGVYRDKEGKVSVADDTLLEVVHNLRFNPALVAGKPVESLVKVKAASDEA